MKKDDSFRKLKNIEIKINEKLFLVCGIVTVVTMTMMVMEFFTCGFFSVVRIEFFYIGVLLIYSFHKELVRWLGDEKVERQGEYFVYGWVILATFLFVVSFLNRGRFSYIPDCDTGGVLKDITFISLEVLGVFFITRFLKILKIFLRKK